MLKAVLTWPQRNITNTIPASLFAGFILGLFIDTQALTVLILPLAVLMIYPTMIGFQPHKLFDLSFGRLILVSFLLNFIGIPLVAFIIGILLLADNPHLFAGLVISALLPTSNMTIAFTMFARGNVTAAVKITVFSLILGALLAPWYLLLIVGEFISIDVWVTTRTVFMVVFLPMLLGIASYRLILRRFSEEQYQKRIAPFLPAVSAWGLVAIVVISMSMNAQRIVSQLEILGLAFTTQLLFYFINYLLAVSLARKLFPRSEGYVLVYSAVLRNLSIALGLAATAFGPNAAFMVTIAFLFQQQAAAWFMRLNQKYNILPVSASHERG